MIYEACFKVIIPELVLRTGAKEVSVESGKPIRILLQSLGGGVLVAWSREVAEERREVVSLSIHPEKDN